MDKRGFFVGLINGYLRGALSRSAITELVALTFRDEIRGRRDDALFQRCEDALLAIDVPMSRDRERELVYLLECLRKERSFDPQHPATCRTRSPLAIRLPLGHNLLALVRPNKGYWGIQLRTREPALANSLEQLENGKPLRELLAWHHVRRATIAATSTYLVKREAVPKFLRELKLLLELYFSGV